MGSACGTDNRQAICQRKQALNTTPRSTTGRNRGNHRNHQQNTQFKFMLNDEEMQLSHHDIPIAKPASLHGFEGNEGQLSIPSYYGKDIHQMTVDTIYANMDQKHDAQTVTKSSSSTSLPIPSPRPPHYLYRDNTPNEWDLSDIEDLEEEMKEQMKSIAASNIEAGLRVGHIGIVMEDKTTSYDEETELSGLGLPVIDKRGSNLVQTESCDWDSDELDEEEDHIKKQIKHLRRESQHIDSKQ